MWKNHTKIEHPLARWIEVIEELYRVGIININFSGGEPLLRGDIYGLIEKVRDIGIKGIELSSNGLLLNKDAIDKFISAGVKRFNLSIDGIGEMHDRVRGIKGSFNANIGVLDYLKDSNVQVAIHTNLLEENIADLPKIIELSECYNVFWSLNIINDTQYYFRGIDKQGLSPKNLEKIEYLVGFIEDKLASNSVKILLKKEYLPFLKRILVQGGLMPEIRCICGFNSIYINANMDVFTGCTALNPVGNLSNHSIEEILHGEGYRVQAERMFNRNCPGCTCSMWMNMDHYLNTLS
ncbi:MAG: radical SAM protein [Desulfobacterales bacterium]|nr:radical SAM protein [Desulfobacterales bacterium]